MIELLINGVIAFVAVAGVYLQSAGSDQRKRRVCRSLLRLKQTLEDIASTGVEIGQNLDGETRFNKKSVMKSDALDELIDLLRLQNQNIARARIEFDFLSNVLEVQAPTLSQLRYHLRGQNDRIEILYDAAESARLQKSLRENTEDWEVSELVQGDSEAMRETLAKAADANPSYGVDVVQVVRSKDEDFPKIVEAVQPLENLLKESCQPEFLI